MFDPTALARVFQDYEIAAIPVVSEEPELEPHTVELNGGLCVIIKEDACQLVRGHDTGFVDLGEITTLGKLVGLVQEQLEDHGA